MDLQKFNQFMDEKLRGKPLQIPGVDGTAESKPVYEDQALDFTHVTKIDRKKLRGTPCDPEQALMVTIYSKRTKQQRRQAVKRRKLMKKLCFYQGTDGQRHIGKIIAFFSETGAPVLAVKDQIPPDLKDSKLVILE